MRPGLLVQADSPRPSDEVVVPRPLLRPSPQESRARRMEANPERHFVNGRLSRRLSIDLRLPGRRWVRACRRSCRAHPTLDRDLSRNGLPLHLQRVHPGARRAVHLRAVVERPLRGLDVLGLAGPRLQRRRLQRAPVRELELPRMLAQRVHRVQVRGRVLVRLAARQEDDSRDRGGDVPLEAADRLLRDLVDAGAVGRLFAGSREVVDGCVAAAS